MTADDIRAVMPAPLAATIGRLAALVLSRPGMSIEQAIANLDHHYRSHEQALRALPRWIRAGAVPGVTILCGALWPVALVDERPIWETA